MNKAFLQNFAPTSKHGRKTMKKSLLLLCLLLLAFGGSKAAFAQGISLCPDYFDTNLSFAENVELMKKATGATTWKQTDTRKIGYYDSISMLGYYSSSSSLSLPEFAFYNWRDGDYTSTLAPRENSNSGNWYFGTQYAQDIKGITIGDRTYAGLQELLAATTVWMITSTEELLYQPIDSEGEKSFNGINLEYYKFVSHGNGGSGKYDYLMADYHYIFAIEQEIMGEMQTVFYQIHGTKIVPVPGAVWLMGTGVAGLMAIRRKKAATA